MKQGMLVCAAMVVWAGLGFETEGHAQTQLGGGVRRAFEVDPTPLATVAPQDWAHAHGVSPRPLNTMDRCAVLTHQPPALLCHSHRELEQGRVFRVAKTVHVFVVHNARLVEAFQAAVRVSVRDPLMGSSDVVTLDVERSRDGRLRLVDASDPRHTTCQKAVQNLQDKLPAWKRFDRVHINRVCRNRGTYTLRGTRMVRSR